ncbi:glycosyltransferase [Streptomyces sp. NPDC060243]|uniref:glycosyltransferase n=1 Tax=Streptomyces sp. NPDC060243 TaxID=3347081 RepID=UPI00366800E1
MRIAFLIHNAYGIGATIRGTAHLSAALAERHDVEVMSVHRVADTPALPFDPRVRLSSLIDMREGTPGYEGDHVLNTGTHRMFPDPAVETGRLRYRTLHDLRLTEWLAWTDADAVIATRPLLNGYLARHGSDRYLRIGQEHLTLASHEPGLRADQNSCLPHLDAFVTLTEADAAAYRTAVPEAADRVHAVPPGSPDLGLTPSLRTSRTIVAAGRLVPGKRYDRLVDAFAKLLPEHPGWTLRIYGRGPEHAALRRRIDRLGLYDDVLLMGAVTPMEPEWAKAAIAAVSSDTEPYGHGILEAMRAGVPVVATDAPHGPARLVAHGVTGLLVPLTGGTDAFAAALGRLMDDQETRDRFGRTARVHAAAHSTEAAAKAYERILDDVHARRTRERAELDALTPRPRKAARAAARLSAPHRAENPRRARSPRKPPRPRTSAAALVTPTGAIEIRPTAPFPGPYTLLLTLRDDPAAREVRLPVPDPGPAVLGRATHRLDEGRWDTYLLAGTTRRRLRAGLVEQGALLGLPPLEDGTGFAHWIPYRTKDGYLAVRAWRRPAHAEIIALETGESGLLVTAQLHGIVRSLPRGAMVRVKAREEGSESFLLAARDQGRGRFGFRLPYVMPLAGHGAPQDVWDFALLPEPGVAPVPLGRVLGDLVDRKRVAVLPYTALEHPAGGTTRVRPFVNVRGDLSLLMRDNGDRTARLPAD